MLERLVAKLLQHTLSKYFDFDTNQANGPLSFCNLRCKTGPFNEKLDEGGHPFELIQGSIRQLQFQLPSSIVDSEEKLIIRCDGALFLIRMHFEYNDEALRRKYKRERQEQLEQATIHLQNQQQQQSTNTQNGDSGTGSSSSNSRLKDWLKSYLQDSKLLISLMNRLEISLEDIHIRIEDTINNSAFGLVVENTHVRQQEDESIRGSLCQLGVYWNYNCESGSAAGEGTDKPQRLQLERPEHTILQDMSPDDIRLALDRTIARRMAQTAPAHTYLLLPLDGSIQFTFRLEAETSPTAGGTPVPATIQIVCNIPYLHYEVRDISCWQLVRLLNGVKEYKAHKPYRVWRPSVSVAADPRAWWHYAATCIRYQLRHRLRWSLGRFKRLYQQRKRYCHLYQKLRENTISSEDKEELDGLENGITGDLAIQDIVLYRILVEKRIEVAGIPTPSRNSIATRSWFRSNSVDEQDYQDLLDFWVEFTDQNENGSRTVDQKSENGVNNSAHKPNGSGAPQSPSPAAFLLATFHVETGKATFYSPLAHGALYLQQKFLDLTFTSFDVGLTLMKDFESMAVQVTLFDYVASEARSNQLKYDVMTKLTGSSYSPSSTTEGQEIEEEPLVALLYTKNPPHANDFKVGFQARVRALDIILVPDCEWITKLKAFVKRVPQFHKASAFWEELSMANFNSWASSRLGHLVKAHTAAAERKNIDLDIKIDLPTIQVTDGKGNKLLVDLGHARLQTEKLAGVAETLMLSVSSHLPNGQASTSLTSPVPRPSASNRDASSVKTPPMLSTQRKRSDADKSRSGVINNSTDSVNFGASHQLDDVSKLDLSYPDLGDEAEEHADTFDVDSDSFFYDIYQLQFSPGALTIESLECEPQDIVSPMDFQFIVHKSILPMDHTLCRLKVRCTAEEIVATVSEKSIVILASLLSLWKDILSSNTPYSSLPDFHDRMVPAPLISMNDVEHTEEQALDTDSSFDDNDFFDAAEENNSHDGSHLMAEHWIADSESVVDGENQSLFSRDDGRRRRQGSMSEVSSISESSVTKRRVQLQDTYYLSAENLARLEEEGGMEDSVGDATSSSDSFHSAVSARYLLGLERDLEEDMRTTEAKMHSLKKDIAILRQNKSVLTGSSEVSQQENSKQGLRLELLRVEAELRVLRAAHCDLTAQRKALEKEKQPIHLHTPASVSRATALLQRKKDHSGEGSGAAEHAMTRNLKRDLLRLSFTLFNARVRLLDINREDNGSRAEQNSFIFSCSHCGAVFRQSVGESKLFTSIEHVELSFLEACSKDQRPLTLLSGGVNFDSAGTLLPSRVPQFISSSSMDEKFLRCAFELRKKASGKDCPVQFVKLRLAVGDIELTARPLAIKVLLGVSNNLKSDLPKRITQCSSQQGLDVDKDTNSLQNNTQWTYNDIGVRLSSVRLLLCQGNDYVGAVAITEVGSRLIYACTNQVYKDRSQLNINCRNLQLIALHDYDSGRGVELVRKRDVYNPVLRLRFRHQLVPEPDVSGWVTGTALAKEAGLLSSVECVYNAHLDIKLDGFSVVAVPMSVERIRGGLKELALVLSPSSKNSNAAMEKEPSHSSGPSFPTNRVLRWRIDFLLKKTNIAAQMTSNSDEWLEDSNQEKLIASLSASVSVQQTGSVQDRVIFQMKVLDITVMRTPGDIPVMEPVSISATVEAPSMITCQKSTQSPQLRLLDESFDDSGPAKNDMGEWDMSLSTSDADYVLIDGSVSHVAVNLSPPSVILMLKLCGLLQQEEKHAKNDVKKSSIGSRTVSKKSRSPISARFFFEGGTVTLFHREVYTSHQAPNASKVAAFYIEGMRITASLAVPTSSYYIALSHGSLVDYTCRSGVIMISGGTRREAKTEPSVLGPGLDLFVLTCNVNEIFGRTAAHVVLKIGKIGFLPLPSCVRGLISFADEIKALGIGKGETQVGNPTEPMSLFLKARKVKRVSFSIRSELFECVLSSKDIPKYVRESSTNPIGVVTFRLKINAQGILRVALLNEPGSLEDIISDQEEGKGQQEVLVQFLEKRLDGEPSIAFSSDLKLRLSDFQVSRTAMKRTENVPISFEICPPLAGEQRITNPFSFSVSYNATAASFASNLGSDGFTTSLAHAVRMEADFFDILVYIAQSEGGLNESLRTTVIPILELTKNEVKTEKDPPKDLGDSVNQGPKEILINAPLVCSVYFEGVRVTCVPGGATRLTESPIVKFALLDLSSGFAACSASTSDFELQPEPSVENASVQVVSPRHLLAGGWLNCEISASYHNRRLVTWEPFIEPWRFETVFGSDVSRAAKLHPVSDRRTGKSFVLEEVQPHSHISSPMRGSGRLRDIGRLLRSPFQSDQSPEIENKVNFLCSFDSDVDFCYLSLMSTAKDTIRSASYPIVSFGRPPPLSILPGNQPTSWLNHFGYLSRDTGPKGQSQDPMVMCQLTDSMPLNINLTGALVENLSEYLSERDQGKSKRLAPHRIRNETGLTLRFQEVLDMDRLSRGERLSKVTISNATEVPLSLKRSLSQSCDPHIAHITIELGSFEDTIGRVGCNINAPKGSRSNTFSFKVQSKIPVDKVGLHQYPLDWNVDKKGRLNTIDTKTLPGDRSLGSINVRVGLRGGIKVVTIESPLFLKNVCDTDLFCEVRDYDGLSLLWQSLVPKPSEDSDATISVPADIVPIIHSDSCRFTVVSLPCDSSIHHESDIPSFDKNLLTRLSPPKPYSGSSLSKGVIEARYKSLYLLNPKMLHALPSKLHFHLCSLRVGSFAVEESSKSQETTRSEFHIPEQRMLLFRSPLAVMNHLAFPSRVQVRLKEQPNVDGMELDGSQRSQARLEPPPWVDLGIIDCGESVSWSGASAMDKIEIRVRFESSNGTVNREFPNWSSTTTIPAELFGSDSLPQKSRASTPFTELQDLKVLDSSNTTLFLSIGLSKKILSVDLAASSDNVKQYSEEIPLASRVISLYAPFWVIDGTGLDLQFKSGSSLLAGQVSDSDVGKSGAQGSNEASHSLGLGELLDDSDLTYLPSRLSFEVLMIGGDRPRSLHVRRRQARLQTVNSISSPWSESIPLSLDDNSYHDTAVLPPLPAFGANIIGGEKSWAPAEMREPYALRSRLVRAPDALGGRLGSRILHVVCRYAVVNKLGRDIEICALSTQAHPTVFNADTSPRPFHFDDSRPLHFRPKEFGWNWSGSFHIKRSQGEVTLCLKHKLKGETVIVTVEFHPKKKAGTCLIVFRLSPHAPYRIENRTIYSIHFHQLSSLFEFDWISRKVNNTSGAFILPYHDAEFAWDEPESGRRSIVVHLADLSDARGRRNRLLGTFGLDYITPGTYVTMANKQFVGQVVSDGPTRVLRISEATRLEAGLSQNTLHEDFQKMEEQSQFVLTWTLTVKLSHGIGISVIDCSPQELLYICFDDLVLEQVNDGTKKIGNASIGQIVINNQLWVTPYPVILRMGSRTSRRRNRRHCALSLSWCCRDTFGASYGDMTFCEWVELNTEPIIISLDGNLATFLVDMIKHAKELGAISGGSRRRIPRNLELQRVLDISEPNVMDNETPEDVVDDLYSAIDYMATSAIASKLRSRYRPPQQTAQIMKKRHLSEKIQYNVLSRHKYYVERLRVSTTAAEISWSGALPIASKLPSFFRPALTFEGLPVLLRPFSSTHAYGSVDEHVQNLKSHYISIWRVLDLLVGAFANPAFLIRACIFTSREALSAGFEMLSGSLAASEGALLKRMSPPRSLTEHPSSPMTMLYKATVAPIVNFQATILHGLVTFTSAWSSMLHYNAARHHASGGLVRSRNPRLFANVDGQDLLVDYVEGENAGRALLSRVRMGAHLSEGYLGHIEGVHVVRSRPKHQTDIDPSNFIIMLTFERILLLNGQLNSFFCDVAWEAIYTNLVYVESREVADAPAYALVLLWFLQDDGSFSQEEWQARAPVNDTTGLDALTCKQIFVSKVFTPLLLAKLKIVNSHAIDEQILLDASTTQ